jgi:tetratricopeptide (TPR) repeat protein
VTTDPLLPSAADQQPGGGRPECAPLDVLDGYLGESAERLLIGASVYREPVDRHALLFQVGVRDWAAARAPDREGPAPPYQAPADLPAMVALCAATGLLAVAAGSAGDATGSRQTVFVEGWTASELRRLLIAAGRDSELALAHRRAAEYWQWRSAAWPQGRRADLHDLLEARHHLFEAADSEQASALTETVCAQLHAWGDLGREAALIQDTLARLPARSAVRAGWIHELGRIAEVTGDHADAERRYQRALDMSATVGDHEGVSRGYHSLGVLAQAQGDYAKAERRYQQSAEAAGQADPADQPAAAGQRPAADQAHTPDQAFAAGQRPAAAQAHPADQPAAAGQRPDQSLAALAALLPAMSPAHLPRRAAGTGTRTTRSAACSASGHRRRQRSNSPWRLLGLAAVAVAVAALSAVRISATFAAPARVGSAAAGASSAAAPAAVARARSATESVRRQTAIWVEQRVSDSAIVACDPAMCSALQASGVPAARQLTIGPGGSDDPLGSNVVVATAALRSMFGVRLAGAYAPAVIASFGSGSARIEVRVVAPDGSAAYLSALRSDLLARRQAGGQLLRNMRISVAGAARRQLAGGMVDARLLTTLAALARMRPVRIVGFSGGPGASPDVPLPIAEITGSGPAASGADLRGLLAFLHAQRPPFLAASARTAALAGDQTALRVEFAEPCPLGLLTTGDTALPDS